MLCLSLRVVEVISGLSRKEIQTFSPNLLSGSQSDFGPISLELVPEFKVMGQFYSQIPALQTAHLLSLGPVHVKKDIFQSPW